MNGERIKAILRERHMTQRKLAELAGYSENYLSKMLNEAVTHPFTDDAALRIGDALGIDPWELKEDFAELTPEERNLVQSLRRVPRDNRAAILRMVLVMLDEASRDSAA